MSSTTTEYSPETFARRWLPADALLTSWDEVEPWYAKLLERPIASPSELEAWLLDVGELNSAVAQVKNLRYIAMTCQTDDPARDAAYLEWVREVEPRLKPFQNALREKYLDNPHRAGLPADRYEVFDRLMANQRELYREANIPRETELDELQQQYQKLRGAMTVEFQGQERTLEQMAPFLEETDRSLRQQAWELVARRRLADREALDDLFDRMVALRVAVAHEAGFASYTDYAYRARERFDYGVEEVARFRDAIEEVVVPLAIDIQRRRQQALGVDTLRPWDLSVDPLGRPPLRPFRDPGEFADGTRRIFDRVDPALGAEFGFLQGRGLLDLANRKGKAPGGYQTTLEEDRLPFIFMNAVGVDDDLRTLLHEGGHAFHALAARNEPLAAYREAPIEFCEVASMSMELLGGRDVDVFYSPDDAQRSYRQLLEGIVLIFPWIATVDAFQHEIYAHPEGDRHGRRAAWTGLLDRFGGIVDWSGYEEARASNWHRQLHIFLYPFYYIEYGIAQLGALGIWNRARQDRPGAIGAYRRALALGGSRPLPELFQAAGLRFAFDADTLRPLMDAVRDELGRISA
jgi:oligoendopeptidase F